MPPSARELTGIPCCRSGPVVASGVASTSASLVIRVSSSLKCRQSGGHFFLHAIRNSTAGPAWNGRRVADHDRLLDKDVIQYAARNAGPCADQTEERIEVGHTVFRKLVRVPFQILEACGVEPVPQRRIDRSAQTHEHDLPVMKGT